MRIVLPVAIAALLTAGCAQPSRFQSDPRAAAVGPDYLDYLQKYPMDEATQYYYPSFKVSSAPERRHLYADLQEAVPADIQRLQTVIPPLPPLVKATEGKGWPELERNGGMPLFLPKQE
jgi:hypothetical protein